jgi:hypothetical protein
MLLQLADQRQILVNGNLSLTVALGKWQAAAALLDQVRQGFTTTIDVTNKLWSYHRSAPERAVHTRMEGAARLFACVRTATAAQGVEVGGFFGEKPPPVSRPDLFARLL